MALDKLPPILKLLRAGGLFVLVCVFCQCSHDLDEGNTRRDCPGGTGYPGCWTWTKSVGGFAGQTITPESLGYARQLVLYPDSTYEWYQAETLFVSGNFTIGTMNTPPSPDSIEVISGLHRDFPLRQAIVLQDHNHLTLTDLCFDCFVSHYERATN